ncbi:MAG: hypothetical protein ACKVP0_07470 [Pirellulaceae bacterium]
MRFPYLRAAWAYMNEEGPGLLPFTSGPPQRGFWQHYRDAVNSYPPVPIASEKELYEMPAPPPEHFVEEPQFAPEPIEEAVPPPTREQVLSDMTTQHENNLAYIDMLPLDEDVREGLKNEAIDKYEQKVRKWLT